MDEWPSLATIDAAAAICANAIDEPTGGPGATEGPLVRVRVRVRVRLRVRVRVRVRTLALTLTLTEP